ncbi:hypothetical protein E3N88_26576 [Mikania micrantha]|uniref:Retrotransposon Copia-like N-terminal domain-containing protein n=1 Tax=Mikania micrantha TaxID=192012 RepID=A0A5N6MWW8_9ASTR|nr:hypothetical protein E3N88_26576 [Mikania micrantha]
MSSSPAAPPLPKKSHPRIFRIKKEKERKYLSASNANVSNFVSVRLSGDGNYHLWKTQMLCLLKAHDMRDLVEDSPTPTHSSSKMKEKYDSLLKGWIFGSLSEDVLSIVVDSDSAKCVWTKLESFFGSCKSSDDQGGFRKSNPPVTSAEKEKELSTTKDENTNKTSNSDTNNAGESMDKEAPQTGKKGNL